MNTCLALLLFASAGGQEAKPRKIVLLAGPLDSHPKDTHEYEKNVILLKHLLDTASNLKGFRTEVHFNGWPADPVTLDDADTIVLTSGGCDRKLDDHPFYVGDRLAVIEKQMKRGCGLVQFHWSTFNPAKHHEKITEWLGGYFDYETGPGANKWYSKIETREWQTAIATPDHPIARGVAPFKVKEEFYFNLKFRDADPRLKPILLCKEGDVRANTVGYAVERVDGGRGFGFTGGHFTANWWIPDFRKLVLNAIAWTAKLEVPAAGVESALDGPIKVMILTGHHYPAHEWRVTTAALIPVLEQDPRVRVSVSEDIEVLATAAIETQDVLVLNYMNWQRPGLSEAGKKGFLKFLERGGGFLLFHGALGAWNASLCPKESDWPEFREKIAGRWWDTKSGHDDFGPFKVEIAAAKHPITAGLSPFETKDELYVRLAGELPAETLVTARAKVTGKDEPLAWAHEYGRARVFETALGHGAESIRRAGALFRRATVWAANRPPLAFDPPAEQTEKALFRAGSPWVPKAPPKQDPPKEKGQGVPPVRALIVTGHNHPAHDWKATTAALREVLGQDPRVQVSVTETPEDLATAKLDAAEVLVLNYCNWDKPGLSDAAKAGLLKYLERGGGLAIVHFANGAFNPTIPAKESDWEEYRTKIVRRVWMHPESGHDDFGPFRVDITPVKHPITEGLAPFETTDELYFKQVGTLPIEPLATARSKKTGKDEPMAFAYEHGKARVFQTVLGHSDVSIRKAGGLIRRGTLWAARQDPPKVLPPDPGLDGGKGGHWGREGEKDWADGRWNQAEIGPFITSALKVGDDTLLRAISIKVGDQGEGGVVFDPDTLSLRAGWTGKFIAFSPARYGLIEKPRIAGEIQWTAPAGPKGRYLGLMLRGNRVGLLYDFEYKYNEEIRHRRVSEWPWLESHEGITAISRTFVCRGSPPDLVLPIASLAGATGALETVSGVDMAVLQAGDKVVAVAFAGGKGRLQLSGDRIDLYEPSFNAVSATHKILVWSGAKAELPKFAALVAKSPPQPLNVGMEEPENLTKGKPPRWSEAIVTKGHVSKEKGPFVIDTLTVPYDNPWKALMFLSGVDFFANGDAAVSTIHGDVWRVSGIDETLEKLTWRRFATGLYQALGLRIVKGELFVLGRDRITRLKDTDGDGEADLYENFCDQLPTSAGGHDYITCLETGPDGSFYFVSWKGLYRVSPDGKKSELVATGFRNPNGMSVGPDGTVTVAPQEGEWTPGSMIFEVKPGGHYGYGGPKVTPERPLGYDPPLVYLPRTMDNSTGGQVWVTGDAWGPLKGQLLNLSFGRCSMQLALRGPSGGAVVPLKGTFASGVMRGRFRPQDGQLYVAGSKGWVSAAVRDGCLQRVRYTGEKIRLPVAFAAERGGVRVTFSEPLDREGAESPDSYALERWNYRYSEKYGSEDYSAAQPGVVGHDPVELTGAKLQSDGRTVLLSIPGLAPVNQLRIRYSLRDEGGAAVRGELVATINMIK